MPTVTPTRRLTGPMSKRLRAARVEAGFTQQELADRIGVVLKTVNNYENHKYPGARKIIVVRAWAQTCGRDFEDIWGRSRQGIARTGWPSRTAGQTLLAS